MVFVLLLLAATAAQAQPILSRVEVSVSHGTFQVSFESADTGDAWVEYGNSAALGFATSSHNSLSVSSSRNRNITESGLIPSTMYYFRPMVRNSSGAVSDWKCSEDGPGWSCDTGTGLGYFITPGVPDIHPVPPDPTAEVDTRMPVITGETFSVSVDASNHCTDFIEQVRACAAANPELNHQVIVPAGASCIGSFELPAKRGAGTCLIRTSTADDQLPPEGVRIDPSYKELMASLVMPLSRLGQIVDRGVITTGKCNEPVCTEGWRFFGIQFTIEDPVETPPVVLPITDVSESGVITVDRPHGFVTHYQVSIGGIQGFNGKGPNGVWRVDRILSPTQFRLQSGTTPPVFTCAAPPCYVPGTGHVVRSVVSRISSASNTAPIVISTEQPHGMYNFPQFEIASAVGNVVQVRPGHGIGSGWNARISGSSTPEYNGVWLVRAATADSITLANIPSSISCAGSCGTINLQQMIQVADVGGNTAANGIRVFTVISPTEIQLEDAMGNGDYTGGGFITFDPDLVFSLLTFSRAAERIVVDRCWVNGRGFPIRTLYGIMLHAGNSGIVDSYIDGISGWRSFNRSTGAVQTGVAGLYAATSIALEITSGINKKIHNNHIEAVGISVFSQEYTPGAFPENVQITRNRFFADPKYMAGSPTSDGRYYPKRHLLELKRGRRFLIEGNTFDGNWSDYTPCGPLLALSPRGGDTVRNNVVSDIRIASNIFRNSSSAIQISGVDSYLNHVVLPTSRISIHNNLFYDIDNRRWRSSPASASPGICGFAVQTLWGIEDLTITHNTAFDVRGTQAQFFSYGYGRSEGVVVRNNVFTHNHDNGAGGLQTAASLGVGRLKPPFTGNVSDAWAQNFPFGSAFSDNLVVPGVRNSGNPSSYDSREPAANFTRRDCESYYSGFMKVKCAGSNESTSNERSASVFLNPFEKNFRLKKDDEELRAFAMSTDDQTDLGADIDAIEAASGLVRMVTVGVDRTTASISYFSAGGHSCAVDIADNVLGPSRRFVDGGEGPWRTVTMPDLTPDTNFFFRLQCTAEQVKGEFRTLP